MIVFSLFLPASCVSLWQPHGDLPHFQELKPWVARSGQPTENGFHRLKELGYRTVVNFRHEEDWRTWEKGIVETLGMKYVCLPWRIQDEADAGLLENFFEILDGPENHPVLYHCKHGRDRTGVMTVLMLMYYEKVSEEEARDMAFMEIRPNLRYRFYVNRRIKDFIQSHRDEFFRGVP